MAGSDSLHLSILASLAKPACTRPAEGRSGSSSVSVTALGLLPTWLIVQANPDWRVMAWLLAGETVGLSLAVIYSVGGRVWLGALRVQRLSDTDGGALA